MAMQTQYHDDAAVKQFPRAPFSVDCGLSDGASFLQELHDVSRHGCTGVDDLSNEKLADTLALILQQFCRSNSGAPRLPDPCDPAALFFSPARQTSFTLSFYCRRLLEYMCCSKSCFVVAILYLARLAVRCPIFELNEFNVHRLICTAVVLAAKWLDDVSYSNAHYAKVAGVQTTAEMTRMEDVMLRSLDYRLFVTRENYAEVERNLLQIAANWL